MKFVIQQYRNYKWRDYRTWTSKKELYQSFDAFQRELNPTASAGFWFRAKGVEYRVIKGSGPQKGKEVTYEAAYAKKLFGK